MSFGWNFRVQFDSPVNNCPIPSDGVLYVGYGDPNRAKYVICKKKNRHEAHMKKSRNILDDFPFSTIFVNNCILSPRRIYPRDKAHSSQNFDFGKKHDSPIWMNEWHTKFPGKKIRYLCVSNTFSLSPSGNAYVFVQVFFWESVHQYISFTIAPVTIRVYSVQWDIY